jgi:hypothetical protein
LLVSDTSTTPLSASARKRLTGHELRWQHPAVVLLAGASQAVERPRAAVGGDTFLNMKNRVRSRALHRLIVVSVTATTPAPALDGAERLDTTDRARHRRPEVLLLSLTRALRGPRQPPQAEIDPARGSEECSPPRRPRRRPARIPMTRAEREVGGVERRVGRRRTSW